MSIEPKRSCGFRKIGGLYLVGEGMAAPCDRLPLPLEICPACGGGIHRTRGWTWIQPRRLLSGDHYIDKWIMGGGRVLCPEDWCPVCRPDNLGPRAGLLWVGRAFYPDAEAFTKEAMTLGVSKRIHALPRGMEMGKTWVFLAHPHGATRTIWDQSRMVPTPVRIPGIFYIFRPRAVEKILPESWRTRTETLFQLEKRGITPVFVPDDDPDHKGRGAS